MMEQLIPAACLDDDSSVNGSLVTVAFQIPVDPDPTSTTSYLPTLNNLIGEDNGMYQKYFPFKVLVL